jgi:hypothetical protein
MQLVFCEQLDNIDCTYNAEIAEFVSNFAHLVLYTNFVIISFYRAYSVVLSPLANYTDRAIAADQRS